MSSSLRRQRRKSRVRRRATFLQWSGKFRSQAPIERLFAARPHATTLRSNAIVEWGMADKQTPVETDRRAFLKGAGKYAIVVPPTMTLLLSTTLASEAVAKSGSCNRGNGNGPEECDPGNSGG